MPPRVVTLFLRKSTGTVHGRLVRSRPSDVLIKSVIFGSTVYRDVNEARSGRGRGQNCVNLFQPNFTFWPYFLQKTKFSVDFRRDFKNFGSKRA